MNTDDVLDIDLNDRFACWEVGNPGGGIPFGIIAPEVSCPSVPVAFG